jgi:hypothetical protein
MMLQAQRGKNRQAEGLRAAGIRARAFSALLVAGAMGQAACNECPIDTECSGKDYRITLGEGETKDTVTKTVHRDPDSGAVTMHDEIMHVEVLDIYQEIKVEASGTCTVTSGAAAIRLTIESDPPIEQDLGVHPSMCYSLMEKCVAIHDAEIEQDIGDPVDGVCPVSNEKVSFTLTIGG